MFRLLTTSRAPAAAALTVLMLALGVTTASAQMTPLSDFNYTGTAIGPIGIDSNPDGTAHATWIADNGGAVPAIIKVDSATLAPIFTIAPDAFGNSGVLAPISGIAVDPITRDVFLSDGAHNRVLLIDPGVGYATIQAPAPMTNCNNVACPATSSADGRFSGPSGLDATDTEVVVADSGNARIQSFTTALLFGGKFTRAEWAGSTPVDVAVNSATGHSFVALTGSNKIDEFDAAGTYVKSIGSGASAPVGLAVDAKTHLLYVAKTNGIDVYSQLSGELVDALTLPAGVKDLALSSVSKVLYVSLGAPTNKVKRYALGNPPTCSDTSAATIKNQPVSFSLACADSAGSIGLKITAVNLPASGSIALNSATGAVTYTPSLNFTGSETFTFRGTTATGVSGAYTATVAVVPATPVVHVSANLGKSSGDILIKVPGSESFVPLVEDQLVPLGTIVDASDGHCITTFANADKTLYAATFWGGLFEMGQGVGDNPPAVMKLRDDEVDEASVDSAKASVFSGGLKVAAKKKKGKKKNKLWGDGKGNFTTTGGGGSASVRGTRWMVENYSNGTLFKVARGRILVRDYWAHKQITLKIGDSYFAEMKPKKKKKKK